MIKLLIILPCLIIMFQQINVMAKVEKPNYDFSVDTLEEFFPGNNVDDLRSKFGAPEVMSDTRGVQTVKFYVAHIRYKFPVLVQIKEGKVLDSFARLPSYFLHDIFFQSLINRFGKQTSYKKVGEEAVYEWIKDDKKHVYSAACTITCFPIFYSISTEKPDAKSILEQMSRKD